MRRLSNQLTPGSTTPLAISALDNPGYGEPNRRYEISGFNTAYNNSATAQNGYPAHFGSLQIFFHDDSRSNSPANGTTEQALLSVILDHLAGKQVGFGACQENAVASDYIASAIQLLNNRDSRSAFHSGPAGVEHVFG
jgi:hypothetical protein